MFKSLTSGLKAVAKGAADATKSVYNDLTAFPSSVTCANAECGQPVAVPPETWEWTCPNSHTNPGGNAKCADCQSPRPAYTNPTATCAECGTVSLVPTTNAKKHATTAAKGVKKAAVATVEYSKATYKDLKSRPSAIKCKNEECKETIQVPETAWDWKCADDHTNSVDNVKCATCEKPKLAAREVLVTCGACNESTRVPGSKARMHLATAATTTKKTAIAAKDATIKGVEHLKAAPETFNCSICNVKLNVPPPQPWFCQTAGCEGGATELDADVEECPLCKKRNIHEVLCGQCNGVTRVPNSNIANSLRNASLTTKKVAKQTVAGAKKLASKATEKSAPKQAGEEGGEEGGKEESAEAPEGEGAQPKAD